MPCEGVGHISEDKDPQVTELAVWAVRVGMGLEGPGLLLVKSVAVTSQTHRIGQVHRISASGAWPTERGLLWLVRPCERLESPPSTNTHS